jgi:trimeric autotransporter adhesin
MADGRLVIQRLRYILLQMKSKGFFLLSLALILAVLAGSNGCSGGGSGSGGGGGNTTPTPVIASVTPTSLTAGSSAQTITVMGSGFISSSVIEVGGVAEVTTYVSSTELTATVPPAQLASGAQLPIVVSNGSTTSSSGTPANLVVNNPSPTISSVSPSVELVNSSSPVVTVTGTNFVSTTAIDINGSARPTTYTSATQASATLTAADLSAAGTLSLTAVNPTPGGGTSAGVSVTVNNPPIGAIQLNPSVLLVGTSTPTMITVTGNTFVAGTVIQVNGQARATTYVNATTVTFVATVADQAAQSTLYVTATNPAPGGGTSAFAILNISPPTATPVISAVSPNSFFAGSGATTISITGTGLTANSIVDWNGTPIATSFYSGYGSGGLSATVPQANLATAGTANVTVNTPTATPALSNAIAVTITNPPVPTLTSIFPNSGQNNTATTLTLTGTGFTALSTAAINGEPVPCTLNGPTQITCQVPGSSLATPGNASVAVSTPAPGGGTSSSLPYTAYLSIENNDIVYNPTDGLLWASVPVSAIGSGGNSVVGIDPVTGNTVQQIFVGSNPNKLALSTDGTQLFVGLDGSTAVAQVNLAQGKVVNQFALGGGPGLYNAPYTALSLAAVPGLPNSVAVDVSNNSVSIYDSGIARAQSSTTAGQGPMAFGSSASTLYVANAGTIQQLTVGPTGITATTSIPTTSYSADVSVQYDSGEIYVSSGQVYSASTGVLAGTFYTDPTTPASGPVVSDSTLGLAFVGYTNYSGGAQVLSFNESNFNAIGSIPVNGVGEDGYPSNFQKIVRWGQNGLALSAQASGYSGVNQIFIFQTPLVADLSSSPADLAVTLTAPSTATTGTAISWVATLSNNGPNPASGAAVTMNLDSSLIINSITPSQGSCGTGAQFTCDLGSLANGASATVKVSATPSTSGTLAGVATVSSVSYDPTLSNNRATTTTVVTGALYGAAPLISSISPNFVQAGSSDVTLTVTGSGFNQDSTVDLGTTALATTFASASQLTATVPAAEIATYGWAAITVNNPAPGGGVSPVTPLTVYASVSLPASGLLFDPYAQLFYATVPSTSTTLTGNSVVSVNPFSLAVGTPVLVGSEPTVMAETSDGKYLFIGLSGANSLAQFDLSNQTLTATIPLNFPQGGSTTTSVATNWLATMPGSDTTLAVETVSSWGNFGILDVSGNTGTFRPNVSGIYAGNNPVFADATDIYAHDNQTSGSEFYRYTVNASGLTLVDGTTLDGLGGYFGDFALADGLVYGEGGGIVNPTTTPPSQVATLPLTNSVSSSFVGYGIGVIPDPSLQKDFLMLENSSGQIVRYDLKTYLPEAAVDAPGSSPNSYQSWPMIRYGQDGIALLSSSQDPTTYQYVTTLILLRGPFVTPQLLSTDSAATITSASSDSISHGSGNTILTLTGTNFLPGMAITWNGSYRTTTLLSSTQATVDIPATDVASPGTASLLATNPGAPNSNALQVTIN